MIRDNKNDGIDIKETIAIILEKKWLIITVTIIFMICGIIYTQIRMPSYSTSLLISISDQNTNGSNLASTLSESSPLLQQSSDAQKQIEIIRSRAVLEPVAKKLNLDITISPNYFPIIGKKIAYKYNQTNYLNKPNPPVLGLSSYAWGGNYVSLNSFQVSQGWKGKIFFIHYIKGNQYQLRDSNHNVILNGTINKTEKYKSVNNEYIEINIRKISAFDNTSFTIRQSHIINAIEKIKGNLSITQAKGSNNLLLLTYKGSNPKNIASILNEIGNSAVNSEIERKVKKTDRILQFLKKQLPHVQDNLNSAETKLNNYRSESGNFAVGAETTLILEQLANYDTRIAELELNKTQLAEKLTPNNPEFIQASNIIEQLKNQKKIIEQDIKKLPQSDQIAINLIREVKIQSEIYSSILQRIQQYEILKVGTTGSLELIDKANIPYKSNEKPSKIIIGISILLGLFLIITIIFIYRFLFKGIENPDIIEEAFDLPIFGSLHKSKLQQKQGKELSKKRVNQIKLISELDPHDLTVESLRSLRTNIIFHMESAKNNIISITGPVPNIGKSFAAAHLAHILVESGKKILLIDADFRKGDVYQYFLPSAHHGLLEVLKNQIDITEAIKQTQYKNLDIIPTGQLGTKNLGLLSSSNAPSIIHSLSKEYDFVIIDNAPILAVTDATEFMRLSALNILIFAEGKHDQSEIKMTLKRLNNAGVKADGFIFNLVEASHSYYGNKYKYKYTYTRKK